MKLILWGHIHLFSCIFKIKKTLLLHVVKLPFVSLYTGNILLIAAVSLLTVLVLMCGLWQYQKHKQNRQESASPNHNARTGHNDVVYGYNEINENAVTELPNRQRTTECPPQLPERNEGFKDSDKSQNKTKLTASMT